MRIAIMGSGGVGGYFGARLAHGGSDVTFVARGPHLEAMRRRGLIIESPLGDLHLEQVRAVDDPRSAGAVDLVVVAVKLWDTEEAGRKIAPLVRSGASVVSFQNGVQKDDVLRGVLGERCLMGGVSYISAAITQPSTITHFGKMQRLVFGEFDGARTARAEALLDACMRGGIDAQLSPNIRLAIWEKFVALVAMSAATTAIRLPIGPIRANARTRGFLIDLMREVVAVGRKHAVPLADDFPEQQMKFFDGLPPDMSASMLKDFERGNRLELPWLSGGVVELGSWAGVSTPLNRAVRDILELYANDGRVRSP